MGKQLPGIDLEILEKVNKYREIRIKELKEGNTQIQPFISDKKIVLQLIPLEAFSIPREYDILKLGDKFDQLLKPLWDIKRDNEYNFEGRINYVYEERNTLTGTEAIAVSYVQFFRNGIIEAVDGHYSSLSAILINNIEQTIILNTELYLQFQEKMEISVPIGWGLSLIKVAGLSLDIGPLNINRKNIHPILKNDLILPLITIDKFGLDIKKLLRISFDRIWNACGYPRSFQYDKNGEFKAV